MILGFFQFFVTFISGFIINKVGRRPMMLCGMGIVLISLLLGFLITFLVDEHESYTVWIIFLHIFGYSISIGPLCFTYAV
jgi:MFS family permease